MSLLRGRRYNRAKKAVPNPHGIGGKSGKTVGGQSDPQQKTADKLAKRHGVGPATIKRDGKFAEGIEKLKTVAPDIERRIAVTRHGERAA